MNKITAGIGAVVAIVLGWAAAASAQASTVEGMASDAAGELAPTMIGVAGAMVALAIIFFGIRFVFRFIRRGTA